MVPFFCSLGMLEIQSLATRGWIGCPFSANQIAGCSNSSSPLVPKRASSVSHAEMAPGTVTESAEVFSSVLIWRCSNQSIVAAAGARPEPLSA